LQLSRGQKFSTLEYNTQRNKQCAILPRALRCQTTLPQAYKNWYTVGAGDIRYQTFWTSACPVFTVLAFTGHVKPPECMEAH